MSVTFNTLHYANAMKLAGMAPKLAEAQADALSELIEDSFATKNDVGLVKQDVAFVKQDLAAVKQDLHIAVKELRAEMKELEYRLTLKLGSMMVVAVTVVAALVKLV